MEIQQGDERASYGDAVLDKLSQKLTNEFGKGFSKRNLERMRKFYIYKKIIILKDDSSIVIMVKHTLNCLFLWLNIYQNY